MRCDMTKRAKLSLALLFVTVLVLAYPIFAESEYSRFMDMAGLTTSSEQEEICSRLDEISEREGLDVVICTTESIGDYYYVGDYADDMFDYCGFGLGEDRSGVILVIAMESRDCYISTRGYGIDVFTDAGREYIFDCIIDDLSDGRYYDAFMTFTELSESYINQAKTSKPYDVGEMPRLPFSPSYIAIAFFIGLFIAGIVVSVMHSSMKSVRYSPLASDYLRKNSLNIAYAKDIFLYRNVRRTPRDTGSSNGGRSGGGGSRTHVSSSGATHGGGGRKF